MGVPLDLLVTCSVNNFMIYVNGQVIAPSIANFHSIVNGNPVVPVVTSLTYLITAAQKMIMSRISWNYGLYFSIINLILVIEAKNFSNIFNF